MMHSGIVERKKSPGLWIKITSEMGMRSTMLAVEVEEERTLETRKLM